MEILNIVIRLFIVVLLAIFTLFSVTVAAIIIKEAWREYRKGQTDD